MAIDYMRTHLMNALKKQVSEINESDVLFVITVPAIWSEASKQFMREAAFAVCSPFIEQFDSSCPEYLCFTYLFILTTSLCLAWHFETNLTSPNTHL